MAVYEFEGKVPRIGKGTYVFESADIIGDVEIGENCYIGAGARIRGDYGTIRIGDRTSIEDNCVIHARPDEVCTIENDVTIGHGAVIHNATIHDWAVIGMGSIVSDYAEIGVWAVVGEGAVVKNKQKLEDYHIAVGIPAKVIGEVNQEYKELWTKFKGIYNDLASKKYPENLKRI